MVNRISPESGKQVGSASKVLRPMSCKPEHSPRREPAVVVEPVAAVAEPLQQALEAPVDAALVVALPLRARCRCNRGRRSSDEKYR
jgi:hypothetical protein